MENPISNGEKNSIVFKNFEKSTQKSRNDTSILVLLDHQLFKSPHSRNWQN